MLNGIGRMIVTVVDFGWLVTPYRGCLCPFETEADIGGLE
jgi:hypothetical protein